LRQWLDDRGTTPVVPNRANRIQPFRFNKRAYKQRHRIENAFCRLKDFRRVFTRYDRLARNFLASVCLAAAIVWWIYRMVDLMSLDPSIPRRGIGGSGGRAREAGPGKTRRAKLTPLCTLPCFRRQASRMDRLKGRSILVVEDETLIALDLERVLKEAGCIVIGPVSTVPDAMSRIAGVAIDAAVLDVNIHAEKSLPIMDVLVAGNVPFVIVSGYARETLPVRFQGKPYLGKPFGYMDLVLALDSALRSMGKSATRS
jgi:CheY-like chemotaxis protein